MNLYAVSSVVVATAVVAWEAAGPAVPDAYAVSAAVSKTEAPVARADATQAPGLYVANGFSGDEMPAFYLAFGDGGRNGASAAAIASVPSPDTGSHPTDIAGLRALLDAKVVGPSRERDMRRFAYSRAGPMWDAKSTRAVLADDAKPVDGWLPFRVEADGLFNPRGPRTVWLGRIDPLTLAIELAYPIDDPSKAIWRPATYQMR